MKTFSSDIADALDEAAQLLDAPTIDPQHVAGAKKFGGLFGRGQQYISLSKAGK